MTNLQEATTFYNMTELSEKKNYFKDDIFKLNLVDLLSMLAVHTQKDIISYLWGQ